MFTKVDHFNTSFAFESGATHRLMSALTDASLGQTVVPGHRTLGRIAWHIVTTYPEMLTHASLSITAVAKEAPVPATAAEIANAYKAVSDELRNIVKSSWTDATLGIVDKMYGEEWARGTTLSVLIRHEVHHRGQMTILMRQAGLVVPDVYGPAKEGWANIGMNPPEV
ncbi:MAG: DinB family protein [Candidatus Zixiibacteriota bacterium]